MIERQEGWTLFPGIGMDLSDTYLERKLAKVSVLNVNLRPVASLAALSSWQLHICP